MFPKKTLLVTAVALMIASCGDDNTSAKQAENAETRVRDYVAKITENYSQVLVSSVESVKGEVTDYQRGEQQSSAKGNFSFVLNPTVFGENSVVTANFVDTINHDDKLTKDKIIAVVDTKYQVQTAGMGKVDEAVSGLFLPLLVKFFDSTTVQTTFKENNEVVESTSTAPFDYPLNLSSQQMTLKVLGATSLMEFNQNDLANPFLAGKGSGELKGINISDENTTVELKPFSITYQQDGKGNSDVKTTALDFVASSVDGKVVTIHSDSLTLVGKGMSIDKIAHMPLGKWDMKLNNLAVNNGIQQTEFNAFSVGQDVQKQGDLYSQSINIAIAPKTDFVLQYGGLSGLKINDITSHMTFNNLSKESLEYFNEVQQATIEQDSNKVSEFGEKLAIDLVSKKANASWDIAVDTEKGKASLKAQAKLADNVDVAKLKEVIASKDNVQAKVFLDQSIEITADFVVPEALVNATGMGGTVEQMGGAFLKKENGNYNAHVEYKLGHLTVNGMPVF